MRRVLTVVTLSQQMGLRNQWVNVKVFEKVLPFILHGLPELKIEAKIAGIGLKRGRFFFGLKKIVNLI